MKRGRFNQVWSCILWLACFNITTGRVVAHTQSHVFAELNWSKGYAQVLVRVDLKEVMSKGATDGDVPWDYNHAWLRGLNEEEWGRIFAKLVVHAQSLVQLKENFALEPDPPTAKEMLQEENFFKGAEGEVLLSLKVVGDLEKSFSIASSINSGKPLMLSIRPPPPQVSRAEIFPAGTQSNPYPMQAAQAARLRSTGTLEEQLAHGLTDRFRHGWKIFWEWWPLFLAFMLFARSRWGNFTVFSTVLFLMTRDMSPNRLPIYHAQWPYMVGSATSAVIWAAALFFLVRSGQSLAAKWLKLPKEQAR